jgi:PadR family transcriptional regulator PadR
LASDTQILKGLLEGCVLKIVKESETYGYEICEMLMNYGFKGITQGIVYPILIRLEKKKLIYAIMKNSPYGPKRKYYYLTDEGANELQTFVISWNEVKRN